MDLLAQACEEVVRFGSRLRKVVILARYFHTLDDADLARAVRFLAIGPIAPDGERKFSIGSATLREAVMVVSGWDPHTLAACYRDVGDTGETVGLLLAGRTQNQPMSLAEAEVLYARLYKARRTLDRVELLKEIFRQYRAPTLKYFAKVITGNLRIGLQSKMVEEAVAVATGSTPESIRLANNRLGDLARVAVAARAGTLDEIEARLFHPMEFMLAKPLDEITDLQDAPEWWVEDKYDGIRSQVHFDHGKVSIFSRGAEDLTAAFPEIVEAFQQIRGSAVVDGEILAWRNGRPLAFTVLQQRIARKKVAPSMLADVPVVFVAYDLLYLNGRMLLDKPIESRRAFLETTFGNRSECLMISPRHAAHTPGEIDRAFTEARERGNEGLVLKRRGSLYEPGRRSGTWMKVKRPYGTLDVVVTAAEQGHGRRASVLSDYTFAVRAGNEFVNVGKAYSGLTDPEIRQLTRILRQGAIERFGRVTLVKPEVVLEVAFDGVQKSPRHKSGYALRFPRILRWRQDKPVNECDTIDQVRSLYEASLENGSAGTNETQSAP